MRLSDFSKVILHRIPDIIYYSPSLSGFSKVIAVWQVCSYEINVPIPNQLANTSKCNSNVVILPIYSTAFSSQSNICGLLFKGHELFY